MHTAQHEDIDSWLCLTREVEHLFGPMVGESGFLVALKRNIQRDSAFCIREHDGPPGIPLLAGLPFSMHPPNTRSAGWRSPRGHLTLCVQLIFGDK